MMPDISPWLPRLQGLCYFMTLLLILALVSSHFMQGSNPVFRSLVSGIPLLLLLPGLSRGNSRSQFYLCTLLLLYFLAYGTALAAPGNLVNDLVLLALVISTFCVASLAMQAAHQSRRLADNAAKEASDE